MTALEDRRPVAAVTSPNSNPPWIGSMLSRLLVDNPDIELASVRLIPNGDGTVGIAGRIGELAGVECPQCHQAAGRPHTEYCPLAIREEVFADPTHGRIDRDIQDQVDEMNPTSLGQRVAIENTIQDRRDQTSQPATRTSQPPTQARPVDDLVGHLRDAVDAARQRRAHERDSEVEDGKGTTWHQTGPDEAHERWRCEAAKCGWEPTPLATPTPLEGDYGYHLREDCPNTGNCIRHAIT